MRRAIRRIMNDGVVAGLLLTGAEEIVLGAYELGEMAGPVIIKYGLPSLTAVVALPFVYMAVRAFDRNVARNPDSTLNRIEDRLTYL